VTNDARPKLETAMRSWAEAVTAEVLVSRDAEVANVDSDGRVSVRMLTPIQEVVAGQVRWTEAPILPRIPVGHYGIGDLLITSKPKVGDRGIVLIRDVSHDEVDEGQGASPVVTPADPRRWDTADAVFLPTVLTNSLFSASNVPASGAAVVMPSGVALRVGSASANGTVPKTSPCVSRFNKLERNMNAVFAAAGIPSAPYAGSILPTSSEPITVAAAIETGRIMVDD
jgi:hypothetical protein